MKEKDETAALIDSTARCFAVLIDRMIYKDIWSREQALDFAVSGQKEARFRAEHVFFQVLTCYVDHGKRDEAEDILLEAGYTALSTSE